MRAQKDLEGYLRISAPFDGMVTDRLVHPGALVGPGADPVLLVIQAISRLRLVVAVPEENIGGIVRGATVEFRVGAYRERTTQERSRESRMRSIRRRAPCQLSWTSSTAMVRFHPACIHR